MEETAGATLEPATRAMCVHAFCALVRHLDAEPHPDELDELPTTSAGLFVTWNAARSDGSDSASNGTSNGSGSGNGNGDGDGNGNGNGHCNGNDTGNGNGTGNDNPNVTALRGCIGTLTPTPLSTGVRKYAVMAGLRDTRFAPITPDELPSLSVGVSVLSGFETAAHAMDWMPGKHGIVLDLRRDGRRFSATYLPEVCVEQQWTKEECLASLAVKAGWRGHLCEEVLGGATVTRFQSSKNELSWDEYELGCGGGEEV